MTRTAPRQDMTGSVAPRPSRAIEGQLDELVDSIRSLIEAINALRDDLMLERWERRYGTAPSSAASQSVARPPMSISLEDYHGT